MAKNFSKNEFSSDRRLSRWIVGSALAFVVAGTPTSRAEMVYELQPQAAAPAAEPARAEDRESTRATLKTAKKANDTVTVTVATNEPVPAAQMENAPSAIATGAQTPAAPIESLSRSELLRRERVREELNNEDKLQERLEQLRLRDEQKRLDGMLNNGKNDGAANASTPAPQAAVAPLPAPALVEETVGTPATDPSFDPAAEMPVKKKLVHGKKVVVADEDVVVVSQASAVEPETIAHPAEDKTLIQVTPKAGVSNMSGVDALKVSGHFSTGVGLGIGAGDRLVFELGYTYSEYGIEMNGYNANMGWAAPNGNYESRALKQNVFDVGLKAYLVDSDAKFRPFIGAGGAYSKGYLNYDDQYRQWMQQWNPQGYTDYEMSSFLGDLAAGFDVKINKNVSVGATFRYYKVLTSRESNGLPPYAFWGAGNYGVAPGYYGLSSSNQQQSDAGNQYAGNSLAKESFYSILAGVSFTF